MSILKELDTLIKADVISEETANDIRRFYGLKSNNSQNRLVIAFSILGALLVGLGIILMVAHNWDDFSRSSKTIIAFIPLILGQAACAFTLVKNYKSTAWREGSSVFLFFGVGICFAMVSQIYNIQGEQSAFILTWMLTALPLVYIMNSSATSLLYLIGVSYYAVAAGAWHYHSTPTYYYWILLLAIAPKYFLLYRNQPTSNFFVFHNWLLPISLPIALIGFIHREEELMFIPYFCFAAIFTIIGNAPFFKNQRPRTQGYRIIGSIGMVIMLCMLSFDWYWKGLARREYLLDFNTSSPEFILSITSLVFALGLLVYAWTKRPRKTYTPFEPLFLLFTFSFAASSAPLLSQTLINLALVVTAILTIYNGTKRDHLGVLNFGLLIFSSFVACRFFDGDISFVLRGIAFIFLGVGFFVANYIMIKKRKKNG